MVKYFWNGAWVEDDYPGSPEHFREIELEMEHSMTEEMDYKLRTDPEYAKWNAEFPIDQEIG